MVADSAPAASKVPLSTGRRASVSFRSGDVSLHPPPILISLEVELPSEKEGTPPTTTNFPFVQKSKRKETPAPTSSTGRQLFENVNVIREIWKKAEEASMVSAPLSQQLGTEDEAGNTGRLLPSSVVIRGPLQKSDAPSARLPSLTPSPSSTFRPPFLGLQELAEERKQKPQRENDGEGVHHKGEKKTPFSMGNEKVGEVKGSFSSRVPRWSNGGETTPTSSGNELFSQRSASNSFNTFVPSSTAVKKNISPLTTMTATATPLNDGTHRAADEALAQRNGAHHVPKPLSHRPSAPFIPSNQKYSEEASQLDKQMMPSNSTVSERMPRVERPSTGNVLGQGNRGAPERMTQGDDVGDNSAVRLNRLEKGPALSSLYTSPFASAPLSFRFSQQVEQQVAQNVFLDNFGFYVSRQEKAGETALLRDTQYCKVEHMWWTEVYPQWKKWDIQDRKRYCRMGVPFSLRPKVWRSLLGVEKENEIRMSGRRKVTASSSTSNDSSSTFKNTNSGGSPSGNILKKSKPTQGWRQLLGIEVYEELCQRPWPPELTEKFGSIIEKDIPRTFSTNIFFDSSSCVANLEQEQLRRILRAYCLYNPRVRYCQGMASIAATFLLVMGEEYEAFLGFAVLMEQQPFRLEEYYMTGFPELYRSCFVINGLMEDTVESVYRILQKIQLPLHVFATSWLLTLFSHCFNFRLVCRIWDMFLCEGWKPVFRVVLGLLKMEQNRLKALPEKDFISVSMILQKSTEKKDPATLLKVAQGISFTTRRMNELRKLYKPSPS